MLKNVYKITIAVVVLLSSISAFSQSITVFVEESYEVEVEGFQIFLRITERTTPDLGYNRGNKNKTLSKNELEIILNESFIEFILFEENISYNYRDTLHSSTFSVNITDQNKFKKIKNLFNEYENVNSTMKYFEIINEENIRALLYEKLIETGKKEANKIAQALNLEIGEISNLADFSAAYDRNHKGEFKSTIGWYDNYSVFENDQFNLQTINLVIELTFETTTTKK